MKEKKDNKNELSKNRYSKGFSSLLVLSLFLGVFIIGSIFSSTSVSGLGVAPGSVDLILGERDYFDLLIFNNEDLDVVVFLSVSGDDFLRFEKESVKFSSSESQKNVRVFVKDTDFSISQRGVIQLAESRIGSDMINVNLGLGVPVSLRVPGDDGFVEAKLVMPSRDSFGKDNFVVRVENVGLGDVSGFVDFSINDFEETKSFSLKGLEHKNLVFNHDSYLSKGQHFVRANISFNNESFVLRESFLSGFPYFNISELIFVDYANEVLMLDAIVDSDWPLSVNDLSVFSSINDEEFESASFELDEFDTEKVPLFLNVKEGNYELRLRVGNQEPKVFSLLITDGEIFIDGIKMSKKISYDDKKFNPFYLILAILVLGFIIFILLKEKTKQQNNK